MAIVGRGIVNTARRVNADLLSGGVTALRRKVLRANENPMPITGQELLNSFMAAGLSAAGVGAAVGAGYGLVSGGNVLEGAKSGAMLGAGWGTLRHMSANRAQMVRRAFGIDVGPGPLAGLRASSLVRDLMDQGPNAVQRAIREADAGASTAVANYLARRREAARAVRSGANVNEAVAQLEAAANAMASWAPSAAERQALERRTRAVIDRISELAARRNGG